MKNSFKIAVVSDMHAFDSKSTVWDRKISHLCISAPENHPGNHPISGLLKLIEDRDLKADVLVSAGDICDKAYPAALKYGWEKIGQLKKVLGAHLLAATAGNHDLDSRYSYNKFDAKGMLMSLSPGFPVDDEILKNQYWAQNYLFLEYETIRVLIVNTSAYHGAEPNGIEHGRVSDTTIEAIKSALEKDRSMEKANILVCHHHPHKYLEIEDSDYSVMTGGDHLVDLLGSGRYGDWMIIHGHKHHPKIGYASGAGSAPPIVFSAGSLCSCFYDTLQTKVRNQFHIIELSKEFKDLGLGLAGRIYSWDWVYGNGWQKASSLSGMPSECGFGFRGHARHLADRVAKKVLHSTEQWLDWTDIITDFRELDYLLPADLNMFSDTLEEKHGLGITWAAAGSLIAQVGKKQ